MPNKKIIIRPSDLVALIILLFPIATIISSMRIGRISTLASYYDEVVGLFALLYILPYALNKRFDNDDTVLFYGLCVITVIGFISNCISHLITNVFPIIVDAIALWKPITCYLALKKYAERYGVNLIHALYKPAKLIILFVFFTSIIGEFTDIGVTGGNLFGGIRTFRFFWQNSMQTGWLLYSCVLIICAREASIKTIKKYLLFSLLPLALTGSSVAWSWCVIEIVLVSMLNENTRFKKRYILVFALVFIGLFYDDFTHYFLTATAPRARLIRAGIKVANQYFPIGSGFATFGSDMASRYYSVIYQSLGWTNSYGLGISQGQYLNDDFFASITAQFGWIGFGIYLFCMYKIFTTINSKNLTRFERATGISTILAMASAMLGSASVKSSMGVFAFAVLGIVAAKTTVDCAKAGKIR